MDQNYLRIVEITAQTAGGGKSVTVRGGGNDDLRVRFEMQTRTTQSPNLAHVQVSNLSRDTANKLGTEFTELQVVAGYELGRQGVIFQGEIRQTILDREDVTDRVLHLYCADGDKAYNFAKVAKTLPAGSTPRDVLDACLEGLKPFGVTLDTVLGLDLSKPKSVRGQVLSGDVKNIMRTLAANVKGQWSIQQGKLLVNGLDSARQDGPIVVNSDTGMIGLPRQTQGGIYVTTLINPAIKIRSQLKIDQASIVRAQKNVNYELDKNSVAQNAYLDAQGVADGVYTVIHQEIEADTRDGPFYMFNTCLGTKTLNSTDGMLTRQQASQFFGPGNDNPWQGPT